MLSRVDGVLGAKTNHRDHTPSLLSVRRCDQERRVTLAIPVVEVGLGGTATEPPCTHHAAVARRPKQRRPSLRILAAGKVGEIRALMQEIVVRLCGSCVRLDDRLEKRTWGKSVHAVLPFTPSPYCAASYTNQGVVLTVTPPPPTLLAAPRTCHQITSTSNLRSLYSQS